MKLERPIVFFDLETTGVDAARDRIVQVGCVRLSPDGRRETLESLVDPETPIPREATAVHHITDEMVRGAPRFFLLAPKLVEFFGDADLGGFGVARFDLPLLIAEFRRAGLVFDPAGRRIVDALVIFHKMEPRNLTAALEFYCGKPLGKAHDASADAEASLDVFLAQLDRYAAARGNKPALPGDLQGLHEFCTAIDPRFVDPRGKFLWRDGEVAFNFGKYAHKTLAEVVRADRSYVEWLSRSENSTPEVIELCRRALAGDIPGAGTSPGGRG